MDKCGKLWIMFCIVYIVPFNTTFSVCVKNFKPALWKNLERIKTINGGGKSPLLNLLRGLKSTPSKLQKNTKGGDSSLRSERQSMEEGIALLQLHPKTKTEEMSHFVRHDTIKSLFGVSCEGVSPSHYVSPRTQ